MVATPAEKAAHNLIAHDAGQRILGVSEATGKVVEIRLVEGAPGQPASLVRRENGQVVNDAVFTGPIAQAAAVLDAMRDTYWMDVPAASAAPASQAPAQAPLAAPAASAPVPHALALHRETPAHTASRNGLAGAVFALAASVMVVGAGGIGYVAWRDALASQSRPIQEAAATVPATAAAPAQPGNTVTGRPHNGQAGRPTTPPPALSLPGKAAEATLPPAPVVSDATLVPAPTVAPTVAKAPEAAKPAPAQAAAPAPSANPAAAILQAGDAGKAPRTTAEAPKPPAQQATPAPAATSWTARRPPRRRARSSRPTPARRSRRSAPTRRRPTLR
jgi:hypothetical protein